MAIGVSMTAVTVQCDEKSDEKSRWVIGNSLWAVGETTLRLALRACSRKGRDEWGTRGCCATDWV
jgi:hypothetical protein